MAGRGGRYNRNIKNFGIMNPDAPCSFKGYQCSLPRIDGYEYCIQHILEDKTAPYRRCCYVYSNSSKTCIRAAPIRERKDVFCKEHARMILKMRLKASGLKPKEDVSPEGLLDQLSHHYVAPHSGLHTAIPDPSSVPSVAVTALEFADDSLDESDFFGNVDPESMSRQEDESEIENGDSDVDPLEHAGVYTVEEAARIYLENLKKLKTLYTGEFQHLHHLMKENRKQFLQDLRTEKETLMSIHSQPKETLAERETYKELQCLSRYHKKYGTEAVLFKQLQDKRLQLSEGGNPKASSFPKCIYSEGSWRCGERCVPLMKHCFKHVLEDPSQVLFQICGEYHGDEECSVPILPLPYTPRCIYHTPVPDLKPISGKTSSKPSQFPEVVNLSDSSVLIVSEYPPDDVMEGDSFDSSHLATPGEITARRGKRK